MINLNTFRSDLENLSKADFDQVYDMMLVENRRRHQSKIEQSKASLYVGAEVRVNDANRRAYGKTFIVEKINPKNVVCRERESNALWKITASLLELVPSEPVKL